MATTADQVATTYPIPTYRYRVAIGDQEMAFSAVSGLEVSYETIEYKDGAGGVYRMPGQAAPVNITLRRGVVVGQSQLYDWISSTSLNQVEKKDISISLTNESGSGLLVTWNISNAFPTKLSAPDFDAASNEVAIEELSLLADAMTIKFH
ncbi:phage tail protein [Pseudomonas sp. NFIX28]|uniref:phage tail protein n=1 Tax=Pseudomonas sp. NFIX28 TaxID=1566235 RepID=UPI000B8702B0|nr:phage tail protein [Pseudomonas sp. NFIX28]